MLMVLHYRIFLSLLQPFQKLAYVSKNYENEKIRMGTTLVYSPTSYLESVFYS